MDTPLCPHISGEQLLALLAPTIIFKKSILQLTFLDHPRQHSASKTDSYYYESVEFREHFSCIRDNRKLLFTEDLSKSCTLFGVRVGSASLMRCSPSQPALSRITTRPAHKRFLKSYVERCQASSTLICGFLDGSVSSHVVKGGPNDL